MKVEHVLHMVGGAGETSYATNSRLQEKAISKTKPIVEETLADLYCTLLPESLAVADLGCSSGPNTFLVMSEIIDAVGESCHRLSRRPPEIQVFLNDLPGNDFNLIFKSITSNVRVREEKGDEVVPPFYVVGVPGSFYGRLFPKESIHFVHSSYSLHWLSQVPQGIDNDRGIQSNKGNIYMAKTSPPLVFKSYLEQFQRDFPMFLKLRYEEIIAGGRMVLTFLGRRNLDPSNGEICYLWGLLAEALNAMVSKGLVKEENVRKFNLPFYAPSMEEVTTVIHSEGTFELQRAEIFVSNWDPFDDDNENFEFDNFISGKNVANCIRAVTEPLLAHHFGEAIIDDLFARYADNVARHLLKEKTKYSIFIIVLSKRAC